MVFVFPILPTVWDETVVLSASVGEYIVMVRRLGDRWFLGAMTNEISRTLEADLSFLPPGEFTMTAFEDGVNVDRYASDYRKYTKDVSRAARMTLVLASGGGWVARFDPGREGLTDIYDGEPGLRQK